jgi:choline dehydrogenase-like flavoprotein
MAPLSDRRAAHLFDLPALAGVPPALVMTDPAPKPPGGGIWDVVVIGAGLGGATLGHALARAGHSVLFLEKGQRDIGESVNVSEEVEDPSDRLAGGHWPHRMAATIDGRSSAVFPALGCGAGGSSLLYSAALERFARSDIESVSGQPHPTGGWPIAWQAMCAYYTAAERLYRVVGTIDPLTPRAGDVLRAPPPASAVDQELMRSFEGAGLHPYRLHVGLGYKPGCLECGGRTCPNQCKSDARLICVGPAIENHGASILSECEVVRIGADRQRVTGVTYSHGGIEHHVRGRFVALAAGALRSPALLLQSDSKDWPDGLANSSGHVGRNLMFHANEWFAVWPRHRASSTGPRKTIGLRDLYTHGGVRLGSIQSTGLNAYADNIHAFLRNWFDLGPFRRLRLLRPALWIVARVAQRLMGQATIFVMIVEDKSYPDNRVVLDRENPERITVEYRIREELRDRTRTARGLIRKAMRGLRVMPLQHDVQLNFGHACGSCRAGIDPEASVVNGDCKAHDLENLYIVDASFMPSSGGTNPGLTVIANALRVADILQRRLGADRLVEGLQEQAQPQGA